MATSSLNGAPHQSARKAVFLDLNGTLVLPLKQERLTDLFTIPGAVESVARLVNAGFICPVVTVQSRIAKGLFSAGEFAEWFRDFAATFARQGAEIVGPYVCPHRYAEPCACKKPNTLLYERAAEDFGIRVSESYVIGDSPDDMRAAARLGRGTRGCLVRTGWAADPEIASDGAPYASVVVDSIAEAVDWILERDRT